MSKWTRLPPSPGWPRRVNTIQDFRLVLFGLTLEIHFFMLSGLEVVFQGTTHLPYCGKSTRLAGVRSSDLSGSTAAPRRRRVIRQGHHQKSHLFFRSRLGVGLVGAACLKPAAALHQQSVNGESDGSLRFPDGALARFRCRSPHRCPLLLLSQVNKVLVGHGNFSLDTP